MKALSLTQPWAQLVIDGFKEWETRSYPTRFRGLLAIHASIGFPGWAKEFAEQERALGRIPARIARGSILGVVEVTDCRPTDEAAREVSALERHLGDYDAGRFAWRMKLILKLDEPIACKGALGLWNVPPDIAATLQESLPFFSHINEIDRLIKEAEGR